MCRCLLLGGTRQAFGGLQHQMRDISAAVGEAAGEGGKSLWTAFESGGLFALLLASRFRHVRNQRAGNTQETDAQSYRGNSAIIQCAQCEETAPNAQRHVHLARSTEHHIHTGDAGRRQDSRCDGSRLLSLVCR